MNLGGLEKLEVSHIDYALKVGYVPESLHRSIALDGENVNKLINGYIAFLKKSKQGANEPGANYAVREMPPEYAVDDDLPGSEPNLE